jgi:hypothetical protein
MAPDDNTDDLPEAEELDHLVQRQMSFMRQRSAVLRPRPAAPQKVAEQESDEQAAADRKAALEEFRRRQKTSDD